MKKKLICVILFCLFCVSVFAQYITVQKDTKGWRIIDGNKQIEIKGVVWSFTPIGETHTYNLWNKGDDFIMQMIDTDMTLLQAMGVNTIRCFSVIPPKWVEYIYTKYGIYTMINDTLGRYGVTVNGTWYATTDYSDEYTRTALVEQAKATAKMYRGVHGVLMYMFGNESNYGLVWSGSNIENLPAGEQDSVKAGYLYSLLEEAMAACKDIDPLRPVGFINGDTQYLDIIKELCPSLDILGVNAYRGYRFYDSFYENIAEVLDKPVVFTEAGADAYNALLQQEDQNAQMIYLKSQWEEIYSQAYGKGKTGNILGGYVFEWIDEWWKHYQNKELDIHNTVGTWANAGYELDYRTDVNNMDEEWFGICAQSPIMENGISKRLPRASYYLMKDIWKLSLYNSSSEQVATTFTELNPSLYLAVGNEQGIKESIKENQIVNIDLIDTTVQTVTPVYLNRITEATENGESWKNAFVYKNSEGETNESQTSAETAIQVTIKPTENLTATTVVKAWTDAPYTNLGDEYSSYYVPITEASTKVLEQTLKYVDVYSATFNYSHSMFDLNGYYHVGHANFEDFGDVFNIAKEAFDIIGYDTYGSKAPIALEFKGKQFLSGLTVIGGPEIWGGAKPQVLLNYFKAFPSTSISIPYFALGAVYTEEFGSSTNITLDPYNGFGAGRKASLYGECVFDPWVTFKLGVLHSGSEKLGASYVTADGVNANIGYLDTLGGYVHLGSNAFQHLYIYANGIYRGVVADTNAAVVRGSFYTADSGAGNRIEAQVGVDAIYGDFVFKPVVRARVPVQKPSNRSLLSGSPFIVGFGNRQAIELEGVLTYDPEGATWFHEWNSEDIEGAPFAFSLTGLYTLYAGETDIIPFKSDSWSGIISNSNGTYASDYVWYDGIALPEQRNLWQVGTRIISNPISNLKIIATLEGGSLGSTGDSETIITFFKTGLSASYEHWIVAGTYYNNCWGPENWWRIFNKTFPAQYSLDIGYSFKNNPSFLEGKNRIGLKIDGRIFDENSADPYGALPSGVSLIDSHYIEITTYFNIGF